MMRLAELQSALQARILHGSGVVESEIASPESAQCRERLRVYEHAYVSRLVDALGRTYSALRSTLGSSVFESLAADFVATVPSVHRSIRDYGGELARFVPTRREGFEGQALAELAGWEWLLADVFDSPDAVELTTDDLMRVPFEQWGGLDFTPHPSLRRWSGLTNAVQYWRQARDAAESQLLPAVSVPLAFESGPRTEWVVWRRQLRTMYRSLSGIEAAALDAMRRGGSFATVCESIADDGDADTAPMLAARLLRTWIEEGLLSSLRIMPGT